jgi:AraC-like DNA-binding protein
MAQQVHPGILVEIIGLGGIESEAASDCVDGTPDSPIISEVDASRRWNSSLHVRYAPVATLLSWVRSNNSDRWYDTANYCRFFISLAQRGGPVPPSQHPGGDMLDEPHAQVFTFAQKAQTLGLTWLESDSIRRLPQVWSVLLQAPTCEAEDDLVVLAMIVRRIADAAVTAERRLHVTIASRQARAQVGHVHSLRALDAITSNFGNPKLGLTALALKCGVSGPHLSQVLKATTGHGLKTHLTGTRLLHAAHYLIDRSLSIQEVAALCGFYSTARLDHEFRKWFKMSPGQFRRWAL